MGARTASVVAWARILSSIAVPIVLAVAGYAVNKSIADRNVGAEYVSMAIRVLSNKDASKDGDLRSWAVAVVDKTAPIPLSPSLRTKLASGSVVLTKTVTVPVYIPIAARPPAALMEPPLAVAPLPKGPVTNGDIAENLLENEYRVKVNALKYDALRQWIDETAPAPANSSGKGAPAAAATSK